MTEPKADSIRRFIFEGTQVRGELVHLDASYQAVLERGDYPAPIKALLGEMLAVSALLVATIKFEGSLIMQVQGAGPLRLLVAQCTHDGKLRGLAKFDECDDDATFKELAGDGKLVITIESNDDKTDRYQGIVALEGESLSEVIEHYFEQSEQLESRVWLTTSGKAAAGMLLQRMPGEIKDPDAWDRVTHLGSTIRDLELLDLTSEEIIRRLFHEEDVRIFETTPIAFRCECSRERIENMLKSLGEDESNSILEEQGKIEVGCEFCNKKYEFDAVDVKELFAEGIHTPTGNTLQ